MGRAAKLKAMRRMVDAISGGVPRSQFLIDRRHKINDVNAVTAVQAKGTWKDRYRKLKKLFENSPEVRRDVEAHMSYRDMMRAERKSDGPTFEERMKIIGEEFGKP